MFTPVLGKFKGLVRTRMKKLVVDVEEAVGEDSVECRLAEFENLFEKEVDSWFGADIACCSSCCDEFLKRWPKASVYRAREFERNSMDLLSFYTGSRVHEHFTVDEYNRLVRNILCPRCDTPLSDRFWPYCLPYLGSDKFEAIIEELGQIAQSTPYLLMQHDLCQLTFSALSRLKALSKEAALPTMLFRARATTKPVASEVTEFGFPPAYVVGQGRYNHAGIPVLYLGSTRETCIAELDRKSVV